MAQSNPPSEPSTAAGNPGTSPSASLLANLRQPLSRFAPFAQMAEHEVDFFLTHAQQLYFAPGEVLVEPASGPVQHLFCIREGAVTGLRGLAEASGGAFQYEPGDLFPAGAAMARRAVTATYRATQDTFVLALPLPAMQELARLSAPFADFLNQRILKFLDLSRRALQEAYASQTLAEQSLETPLADVARHSPVTCPPDTPLRVALAEMQRLQVGSMLVTAPGGAPLGILTRHDVLGRVTLAGVALDTPISQVMAQPVHSLTQAHTAQDAALLMSQHGIRHVPVTREGVVVGIVSERDLFALQRLSLRQISSAVRAATDVGALQRAAQDIRRFAGSLLGQGVQARQLSALVSHLNDVLTRRLLEIQAQAHAVSLSQVCWLALGSEGRAEQTIATDQDNALILPHDTTPAQRAAWLAFGRDVNLALDACGYPLCEGLVMAGEPACCLTLREWRDRFAGWIAQGAPQDLLNASIYFDFRALVDDQGLAHTLRCEVADAARSNPRFLKQLALNALARGAPLNWHGGVDTDAHGTLDLKLQGTALFVDAARVYSLAHGIAATGTRERLAGAGPLLGVAAAESEGWAAAFEFLQMLRLRAQMERTADAGHASPNRIAVASLHDIDRRILKEALRAARSLQQRLQLDYER
jgi:CBS domain-containing protein